MDEFQVGDIVLIVGPQTGDPLGREYWMDVLGQYVGKTGAVTRVEDDLGGWCTIPSITTTRRFRWRWLKYVAKDKRACRCEMCVERRLSAQTGWKNQILPHY